MKSSAVKAISGDGNSISEKHRISGINESEAKYIW